MQFYSEFTQMTPAELLAEAKNEVKAGTLMDERDILLHFIEFRQHLQQKKLAPITIRNRLVGVRSFYTSLHIEVPKLPRLGKAKPLKKNKAIPTKKDIQDVLKLCDPLEKALVLVGVSSGLAAAEITNLRIKDFINKYDDTKVTTLSLRREKVELDFITFLSPEATEAVQDYLSFRSRTSKIATEYRNNQLEKQKIRSDEGYLFVCRNVTDEYLMNHDEELRKINDNTLMHLYRRLAEKAQKTTPSGTWNVIRSHNMRKYFNSTLKNAGCSNTDVELWMGHTIGDTQEAYYEPNAESLKERYIQYMPHLLIQKEFDPLESLGIVKK